MRSYDSGMDTSKRRRAFLQSGAALVPMALAAGLARAQVTQQDQSPDRQMPNGMKQSDVILKADYEQNVKDSRELTALAKSIELDLDKEGEHILSLGLLRKLDDVERLTKRIRTRIRR